MEIGSKVLKAQKPYIDKFRPIGAISVSQVILNTLLQSLKLKTAWVPKPRDLLMYLPLPIGLFFFFFWKSPYFSGSYKDLNTFPPTKEWRTDRPKIQLGKGESMVIFSSNVHGSQNKCEDSQACTLTDFRERLRYQKT